MSVRAVIMLCNFVRMQSESNFEIVRVQSVAEPGDN
jgi:hypothetical protein